ncbi:hypothetical protein [Rhizobium sp. Root1203]|jgi:hypothetical protein|nr:hypothetical protein [Rhizobium sp. Root1203]
MADYGATRWFTNDVKHRNGDVRFILDKGSIADRASLPSGDT